MLQRLFDLSSEELDYFFHCLGYQLTDSRRNPKRKVLVNGSPKTGTTWMLKMIESIPGYHTVGNFDGEITRYNSVLPGDVVHGHDWYSPELAHILLQNGIRVVLLVRDPRDQLVSRLFHVRRVTSHAWHQRLKGMSLDESLMVCIEGGDGLPGTRTMIELTQSWLTAGAPAVCLRYEELLAEPEWEFRRVLQHLEIKLPVGLLRSIIAHNQFERLAGGKKFWRSSRKQGQADPNSHFRKGITGDWRNYLKAAHITKYKEVAGDKLIELGYESDLNW